MKLVLPDVHSRGFIERFEREIEVQGRRVCLPRT